MNISLFFKDVQSKQLGGLLLLARGNVMYAVVKLIGENCPNVSNKL